METRTATRPVQPAAKRTGLADMESREKDQAEQFRPSPTLLLDVSPAEGKAAEPSQDESSEGMLQQLLINTEASAQRTQWSRKKWQLASLILGMLLLPMALVIGRLYSEMNAMGSRRGQLEAENASLNEQVELAETQITGFRDEIEALVNRNIELAGENASIKSQNTFPGATTPVVATEPTSSPAQRRLVPRPVPAAAQTLNVDRVTAIKKGRFPSGVTRAELTAALGEPDRIYKSRGYEQLVYFDRDPGRFWFIGGHLVQSTR